jgi:hypothetical protein
MSFGGCFWTIIFEGEERNLATTRIISMHVNKGATVAQCLSDRTDYAKNPEKTDGGTFISSYGCDPHTADAEFLFAKRQYKSITGREQKSDVIAYQVRQSFRPGEITPEDANKLGYEFASRFLKGKHAFLVCTHVDKHHIHNHIIWNSTTIDCRYKFRDFLGSGRAVAKLSDIICFEHGYSIIEQPKRHARNSYNKWLGEQAKPSHREQLREAIDKALAEKPESYEAFLSLIQADGYRIKQGANVSFTGHGQKQRIRLRSLGDGYSEAEIKAVIAGERQHSPKKKMAYQKTVRPFNLLIDIEAQMHSGKGGGFKRYAGKYNLKEMAKTVNYLTEKKLLQYDDLAAKTAESVDRYNALAAQIKSAEKRMAEIAVLETHIANYARTHAVFDGYKKSGYSKKYLAEHEADILLHKAAKKAFDELGLKKLPTIKSLRAEYAELLAAKKTAYPEYQTTRKEMKELTMAKANIDRILEKTDRVDEKKPEHGRQ